MISYMNPLQRASAEAWDSVEQTISELSTDDWDRPTPCTGWSVKDVISHVGHMEGMLIHHFDQPDPPPGWMPEGAPLDQVTSLGVASRRPWPIDRVVEEIKTVAEATRKLMARLDLDWEAETATPVGPAPLHIGVEMRTTDLVIHLCDVRTAIGRSLEDGAELAAREVAVGRAVRLTPWAWAKRVRAGEGQRLRLDLSGTGSLPTDVVMTNGKAAMVPVSDMPDGTVEGSSFAYLLAATGRHGQVASAGGLVARGEPARLLLEKFRLVG
jgi:uncharacterized protein (TIGR03083 family)